MENNELKIVCIKNYTCYYFEDIIKLEHFDLDNILINEKSHENTLIFDISYKILIVSKLLRIKFDKIDGIIKIYNGTRYLTLFDIKRYDVIYDRIRYHIILKSSITDIFSPYFFENQSWFLWLFAYGKILILNNVIILIKSVLNTVKHHYYYKIFLEKCPYQLAKK